MIDLEEFHYDRHSFSTLKSLMVYDCSNLKYLFRVANGLKKLEKLIIRACPVLEALINNDGSEINGVVELPQLLQLKFYDLPNFTSIYPENSSSMCALFNSLPKFPKLEKLVIDKIKKLKQIWGCEFGSSEKEEVNNISVLREIEVYECDSLVNLFPSNPMRLLTHLERLYVGSCGSIKELFNIDLECNGHEGENNISMLREIVVLDCDSLVNLFPSNPMRLLTHLERLEVIRCGSIKELFNIDQECLSNEVENNIFMLREIEVEGCYSLVNLFPSNLMRLLTNLKSLELKFCGIDMESRGEEDDNIHKVLFEIDLNNQQPLFPNLEKLNLLYMNDMSHVWKCNNWNNLTSIRIYECIRIKYLFSPLMAKLLSNLHTIEIDECREMEEVVSNRDDDVNDKDEEEMSSTSTTTTFFPHLHSLDFCSLTNLTHIGGGGGVAKEILYLEVKDMIGVEDILVCASDPHTFSSLKDLRVEGCSNLKYLFRVANGLKKLERLTVRKCNVLEVLIQKDESEISGVVELPQLLVLELYDLPNFTSIYPDNNNNMCALFNSQVKFVKLEKLRIHKMKKLKQIWDSEFGSSEEEEVNNISMLRIIEVWECDSLVNLFPSNPMRLLTHLERLHVRSCSSIKELFNIDLECNGHEGDNNISMLREIRVVGCDSLVNLFPANPMRLLTHLESLFVANCGSIKDLFNINLECVGHEVDYSFSKLRVIEVWRCDRLVNLFPSNPMRLLTHLERLVVGECGSIKELFNINLECVGHGIENNISMLREIRVVGCDSLVNLFPANPMRLLTHLESLFVANCGSIKDFFNINLECVGHEVDYSFSKLRVIEVWRCDRLVNLFPSNPMRLLTHLERLVVGECGSIKELFNIDQECLSNEAENNIFMLREIKVEKCDRLENLFPTNSMRTWNHLERLEVRDCGSIEVIFNIDLGYEFAQVSMNNLRSIDVSGSKNVRELWRIKSDEKNFMSICGFESVEVIRIEGCRNVFTTSNFNTKFDMKAVSKESRDDNNHTVAFPSILHFHSLRDLRLSKCEGMEVVFEIDVNNQQPLLTNLQRLELHEMNDMSHVWKCNNWNKYLFIPPQRRYSTFHSLTSITINKCNRIKYLFSPLMVKLLSKLQKIKIHHCPDMEEVVSNRDDDDDTNEEEMSSTSTTTTFFPHLQCLDFWDLTNLTRIGGGGEAKGTKTSVIQHKVSHVGVVSWCLCQFSKEIIISSCNRLSSVIPLDAIGQMQKLEVLRVEDCKSLEEVFESQYINGNSKSSININKGSVDIDAMAQLSNLKKLVIKSCNLLQHVFTFSMLESLKHLEKLKIEDCKAMKVIVEKENGEQTKDVVFRSLKSIKLHRLPNLEGFFLGMNNFSWQVLEKVMIIECPQMMNFTCGKSTTPVLEDIRTSLGRHSLECGLNFHHLKIHQVLVFIIRLYYLNHLAGTLSFHNLIDLQMKSDEKVKCIIPSNELLQLQNLETIDVYDCKLVEEVFEVEGTNEGTNNESQIVVEIPNLRQMELHILDSLKYIWKSNHHHQRRVLKFPNLTTLSIWYCGSLKHVFTSSMVGGVLQLQDLRVMSCKNMEVIVKTEEEDEVKEGMELFPCLKSLELVELSSLKGFCSGKVNFSWPLLHTLKVPACPEITDMLLLQH
ncbi:hypothetical protein R6Q59_006864 [Mikania micrantha]